MPTLSIPSRGLPIGLTGAVSATRYVGGTAAVAPVSGTFAVGDFIITAAGAVYVCTVAGTPGTWVTGAGGFANPMTTAGDIIYGGAAGLPTRFAIGTQRFNLQASTGTPPTALVYAASLQSLMTAQGDIIQASAANTPARLSIGTLYQIPHVNAGATALEYGDTIPKFLAYNSTTDTNQTGNGALATVDYDTEVYDIGGNFAADVFTAPNTCKMAYTAVTYILNVPALATQAIIYLVTSNATYSIPLDFLAGGTNTALAVQISGTFDMDAGDTAFVQVKVSNGAGDTASIYGGANRSTYFSGAMVP